MPYIYAYILETGYQSVKINTQTQDIPCMYMNINNAYWRKAPQGIIMCMHEHNFSACRHVHLYIQACRYILRLLILIYVYTYTCTYKVACNVHGKKSFHRQAWALCSYSTIKTIQCICQRPQPTEKNSSQHILYMYTVIHTWIRVHTFLHVHVRVYV